MSEAERFTTTQVAEQLDITNAMVRRYQVAYEHATGQELPRHETTNARLMRDDEVAILERAHQLVKDDNELSVEDAVHQCVEDAGKQTTQTATAPSATTKPQKRARKERSRMINHFKRRSLSYIIAATVLVAIGIFFVLRNVIPSGAGFASGGGTNMRGQMSGDVNSIIEARELTPDDVTAALKTYQPSGRHDEFIMFSSGGHSGQVHVIGIPSMRLLRTIAVFTPEPWQGYGYGARHTMELLEQGSRSDRMLTWGDTHHPALSETGGMYDGEWLFVNDKANARIAVIDLRDFETKQIVPNPIAVNDHGGAFVTPNTEWVIQGGQYAAPPVWEYAPIEQYEEEYRGMVTFWKFDRETGRIVPEESFAMKLPPYWQDLCDAGKRVSEGWVFCNSFNTELATGGVEDGNPPFEAGASQRDMDYLHVINLERAAELVKQGRAVTMNGFDVLTLDTVVQENLLYFVPEPKSPHGIDVAPDGNYLVVSGKLDPHVTVYTFDRIQRAIAAGNHETDQYGVPILDFDDVVETQIEVGLGPLHTQFDHQGYAYTSIFLESAVARWAMGGPYADLNPDPEWTLVNKIPIHYNVGHVAVAGGDTVEPDGRYLVSMNKWSVDRFNDVGPLLPQNFQLIDIAEPGTSMQLLYDMPIGFGEPHYAQIIRADKLSPWEVYPDVGWDSSKQAVNPNAPQMGQTRIERNGNKVEIFMTAMRSHFNPEHVEIYQGDHVTWHITNVEQAKDATHGFAISGYNISTSIEPGKTITVEFVANQDGVFSYYCTEFCSALHLEMTGYLRVKPRR